MAKGKLLADYLLLPTCYLLLATCYLLLDYLLLITLSQASEEKLAAALEDNHTIARLTVDLRGTRAYPNP